MLTINIINISIIVNILSVLEFVQECALEFVLEFVASAQCQGQAFLLPVFCGDKQEIRSVKDNPFCCQCGDNFFLFLSFSKQSASLHQLLSHMATLMMMMTGQLQCAHEHV